jgi:hypothetical protein
MGVIVEQSIGIRGRIALWIALSMVRKLCIKNSKRLRRYMLRSVAAYKILQIGQ